MIDVTAFGAIGDGITDDTVAIQNAINSLVTTPPALPTGGTVYFPVGTYLITSALEVSSYIELLGESLNAKIDAQTADAAIKVADSTIHNNDITIRRLHIHNRSATPIGVDSRYMTFSRIVDCTIDDFSQYGIYYGGVTNPNSASWSNSLEGTGIYNSPTCIYLYSADSSTDVGTANWITIERCLIIPTDTTSSIGIDLVNGGAARVINNDIGYASNATAIMLRQHTRAEIHDNRFEDIGVVAPSHPIEKEFAWVMLHLTGVEPQIHYQTAEYLNFTGNPTGGTFTLTRGAATTSAIAYSTTEATLESNIRAALEGLTGIGAGNVEVDAFDPASVRIAWRNGRGRSNRPNLTANGGGLTGGTTPGVSAVQGTQADAIQYSYDIVLGGVMNDTDMPSVTSLGRHLDLGTAVVARQPILSILNPGTSGVLLQRDTEDYPRLELTVNGRFQWTDPSAGGSVGGLSVESFEPGNSKVAWDDDMSVALSRRTTNFSEGSVTSYYRGSLYRYEGATGARDQLRFGMKDKDNQTYVRHLYPGFTASQTLDFPSIAAGTAAVLTMTATGAQVGDAVVVIPPTGLETGLVATGFVSATSTVKIRVLNGTTVAVNPASATWTVLVLQP
jgi:hypothetical protein